MSTFVFETKEKPVVEALLEIKIDFKLIMNSYTNPNIHSPTSTIQWEFSLEQAIDILNCFLSGKTYDFEDRSVSTTIHLSGDGVIVSCRELEKVHTMQSIQQKGFTVDFIAELSSWINKHPSVVMWEDIKSDDVHPFAYNQGETFLYKGRTGVIYSAGERASGEVHIKFPDDTIISFPISDVYWDVNFKVWMPYEDFNEDFNEVNSVMMEEEDKNSGFQLLWDFDPLSEVCSATYIVQGVKEEDSAFIFFLQDAKDLYHILSKRNGGSIQATEDQGIDEASLVSIKGGVLVLTAVAVSEEVNRVFFSVDKEDVLKKLVNWIAIKSA